MNGNFFWNYTMNISKDTPKVCPMCDEHFLKKC